MQHAHVDTHVIPCEDSFLFRLEGPRGGEFPREGLKDQPWTRHLGASVLSTIPGLLNVPQPDAWNLDAVCSPVLGGRVRKS